MFKKTVDKIFRIGEIIDEIIIPIHEKINLEVSLRKRKKTISLAIVFTHSFNREYLVLDKEQTNELISSLERLNKVRLKLNECNHLAQPTGNVILEIFSGFMDFFKGDKLDTAKVILPSNMAVIIHLKRRRHRIYYVFSIKGESFSDSQILEARHVDTFTDTLVNYHRRM